MLAPVMPSGAKKRSRTHLAIGLAGDPLDDLRGRVIGDVLIGVAGARRADIVQGRRACRAG